MSAELLGIPRDFEYKGCIYKVCPRDLFIQGVFAEWVKTEAGLDLWKCKAKWPADLFAEQMKILNAKISGKQFTWGCEDVHNAAWTDVGQKHLLYLKMKRGEAVGGECIERETLDDIANDADKWQELLMILWEQDNPDFFAHVKKEMGSQPPSARNPSPTPTSVALSTPAAQSTSTT